MADLDAPCQMSEESELSLVELKGEVNVLQAALLKELFLTAIDRKKTIRVDLSKLDELDLSIIQLLYAAKKMAIGNDIAFEISPLSDSARTLIGYSGASFELALPPV